jgi:hypothetical protein
MTRRVYGTSFAGDSQLRITSQIESTASATARGALQVEISIDLGANSASAEFAFVKANRALVLSRVSAILDELESGRQPWPPAFA